MRFQSGVIWTRLLCSGIALVPARVGHAAAKASVANAEPVALGDMLQVLFGLIFILLLIAGAAFALRRFARFQIGSGSELRILGGLPVGGRERIVLLQVGEAQLLVGVAPGRVQTLYVLEKPLPLANAAVPAQGFAQRLAALMNPGRRP